MAAGASTTLLGSFGARLGIDTSEYARGIINAETATRVFGATFVTFVQNPILGSIDLMAKAGGAAISMSKDILADAEAIQRMGQATGLSVELLQALRAELDLAGHGADAARGALAFFTKTMGEAKNETGPAIELLRQWGITADDLSDAEFVFRRVIDEIGRAPDAFSRSAITAKFFGEEAGTKLVNAIGGGTEALDALIRRQRDFNQVFSSETVNVLADANTWLGQLVLGFDGLKRALIGNFLAGFFEEFDTGTQSVQMFSRELSQTLLPYVKNLGSDLQQIVGSLSDVARLLREIEALTQSVGFQTAVNVGETNMKRIEAQYNFYGRLLSDDFLRDVVPFYPGSRQTGASR